MRFRWQEFLYDAVWGTVLLYALLIIVLAILYTLRISDAFFIASPLDSLLEVTFISFFLSALNQFSRGWFS